MAAVVAFLLLLLWPPQRATAQGCPTLDTGDFTATLIAANSDCHTPARLSVVYRNAVAGFTAMTYSVSKDRTTWGTPVVTPRPGNEAVLPLDGWNEGDPIYIRATATCGTQQPRVVLPKIIYHVKTSADVQVKPVVTPADPVDTVNGQPVDEDELEFQWEYTKTPTDANSWKPIFGATEKSVEYVAAYPGTYYLRRTTRLGDCVAVGGLCTLTVDPGITVTMSASERRVVIDHKNPFLLTAGLITGPAARTYVWQRSLDGKTWTDVGTDVSYTETQRLAPVVYYRRIIRSGTCETKGEPITVIFKRRYPAMVNPQLRQRVDQHW